MSITDHGAYNSIEQGYSLPRGGEAIQKFRENTMETIHSVETVKQEAARLGVSISEVRRRRNAAAPPKETLRLIDGGVYKDGFGDISKVRLLDPTERTPTGTKFIFVCDETYRRYTEYGLYHDVNGPLVKFNLIEKV